MESNQTLNEFITEVERKEKLTSFEQLQYFGSLFGKEVLLPPIQSTQKAILEPKKTAKSIYEAGKKFISSGEIVGGYEFGERLRRKPQEIFAITLGDIAVGLGIGKAVDIGADVTKRTLTLVDPSYAPVRKNVFGVQTIKGVGVDDIDIVPPGDKIKLDTDPKGAIKLYEADIPYKETPSLPKTTSIQKQIIEATKETGGGITGSFAQEVFLEPKYTKGFKDLDIGTPNVQATTKAISKRLSGQVKFKKGPTSTKVIGTKGKIKGKELADIVPLELAEGGFAKQYGIIDVQGVPVFDVRSRLAGKTIALGEGIKPIKTGKDIELLTGGKATGLTGQATRGGFGFSFAEQAEYLGKTGTVATAQRDLFSIFRKKVKIDKPVPPGTKEGYEFLEQSFFASPFDIKTGRPQLRASRLGVQQGKASFLDLLSGNVDLSGGKPQAVIFKDVKVADLPKEIIPAYKKALKTGDTEAFFKQYREFQARPTGEFKAFGFPGGEAELTLPKGETIRKTGRQGVTLIEGKRVPIISAEIVKASDELESLTKLYRKGTLKGSGLKKFKTLFKQETGFDFKDVLKKSSKKLKPALPSYEIAGVAGYLGSKAIGRNDKSKKIVTKKSSSVIYDSGKSRAFISKKVSSAISGKISSPLASSSKISPKKSSGIYLDSGKSYFGSSGKKSFFSSYGYASSGISSPPPQKITPPPSPPGINFGFDIKQTKSKKKKKSKLINTYGRYQPQLRSAGEEIFGKRTNILTGIGFERPISR